MSNSYKDLLHTNKKLAKMQLHFLNAQRKLEKNEVELHYLKLDHSTVSTEKEEYLVKCKDLECKVKELTIDKSKKSRDLKIQKIYLYANTFMWFGIFIYMIMYPEYISILNKYFY